MSRSECIACGAQHWVKMPSYQTSMLSDGRRYASALAKESCVSCGLVRHIREPHPSDVSRIFDAAYKLSMIPIDDVFLRQRQRLYADWIFSLFSRTEGLDVFEIGAGNGSLLAELSSGAPAWHVSGIEPVDAAAQFGRDAGYDVRTAFLDEFDVASIGADLVVSVNVIEHVSDPVSFLRKARNAAKPDGNIMIVCPDGARPSTELLIYDHIHSFTVTAMGRLAAKAGLRIVSHIAAPAILGPFQAFVLAAGEKGEASRLLSHKKLIQWRVNFLNAWKDLDGALEGRLAGHAEVFAFGCGENAHLLRAYAPRTWARVGGILADVAGFFDDRSVEVYRPAAGKGRTILLAVRPELQPSIASRMTHNGDVPILWNDLVISSG